MNRASADVGFIFIAYNLRRIVKILGQEAFKKYLRMLALLISEIFEFIWHKKLKYEHLIFCRKDCLINFVPSLNRLIFDEI